MLSKEQIEDIEWEIWLDGASTTFCDFPILCQTQDTALSYYANPSSIHSLGVESATLLRQAREAFAATINAKPEQIIFTSGGTESNAMAFYNAFPPFSDLKQKRFLLSAIEHPSIYNYRKIFPAGSKAVDLLLVNSQGYIDTDKFSKMPLEDVALLACMFVNNEVGTIQPIGVIGKELSGSKAHFHVDAVQAYMKIPIDVNSPALKRVDSMSFSGHKIGGPQGVGALFIREPKRFKPLFMGGGQEFGLRSGTENLPSVVGMLKAIEANCKQIMENYEKFLQYKQIFYSRVMDGLGELGKIVHINGSDLDAQSASPYILNLSFSGLPAEAVLHELESRGVYVSSGSACSSNHKAKESYVLTAMGAEKEYINSSIRFSFSDINTDWEIGYASEQVAEGVKKLYNSTH